MPQSDAGAPRAGEATGGGSFACQATSASPARTAKAAAMLYFSTTSTANIADTQTASMIGHADECGSETTSAGYASKGVDRTCSCPSSTPSPTARRRRSARRSASSQFGYALVTVGVTAKLTSGGGDGTVHSSVGPRQGSEPDGTPRLYETTRLPRQTRIPASVRKPPTVSAKLYAVQPSPPG